jgi:hypothetical protein
MRDVRVSAHHADVMLQITRDGFISSGLSLEPGDLHDFDVFADRTLASDARAGFSVALLSAIFAGPDRV